LWLPTNKREKGEKFKIEGTLNTGVVEGEKNWEGRGVWVLKVKQSTYLYDKKPVYSFTRRKDFIEKPSSEPTSWISNFLPGFIGSRVRIVFDPGNWISSYIQ